MQYNCKNSNRQDFQPTAIFAEMFLGVDYQTFLVLLKRSSGADFISGHPSTSFLKAPVCFAKKVYYVVHTFSSEVVLEIMKLQVKLQIIKCTLLF